MPWEIPGLLAVTSGVAFQVMKVLPAWLAIRKMRRLCDVRVGAPMRSMAWPRVTVIVPARNEETVVERALTSLSRQDYPNFQVIAVDDRSDDRTGELIEQVAARSRRLKVIHIAALPPGWLGKNHANWIGAGESTADWLLFTDADVFFEPETLRLAMTHSLNEGLDHLTLMPAAVSGGVLESAACCLFQLLLFAKCQPWQMRNPARSDAFVGIGAFNLVRRPAYQAIGTHRRLRMEVLDDIKLGKLLKRSGFVSDVLSGRPQISLRWQAGLRGLVRGLEKNAFAGADYSIRKTIWPLAALLVFGLLPPVGLVLAAGWMRVLFAIWCAVSAAMLGLISTRGRTSVFVGLAFPVASVAMAIALLWSMILTLRRGGISWRKTFYRLEDLRRGSV